MNNIFHQILAILTTFPGNLVYHLILASSVAGALQAALYLWRDSEFPQGRRMVIGLGFLLGIRFLLFLAAGLTTQGFIDSHTILPILDRSASIFGLIIIIWLWAFPEPSSLADIASIFLGLLTIVLAILSWVWWQGQSSELYFNAVWLDVGWSEYALILITLGIALLIIRHPNGWGYGLSMLLLAGLGHVLHLSIPVLENDFPGLVRLAQIAAFPLLLALPRRFSSLEHSAPTTGVLPEIQLRPKYGIDPNRIEPLLTLMSETSQPKLFNTITRMVAETLLADIVLLFSIPNSGQQTIIQCGYDLIRQEDIDGISIDQDELPLLTSAMQQSRSLRLPASSTSQDLFNLGKNLDFEHTGHLLAAFIPSSENGTHLWGIVLLSPYSNRRWSGEDQKYLEKISASFAAILQRTTHREAIQNELEITQQNLQSFQKLIDETQAENSTLKAKLGSSSQPSQKHQNEIDELIAKHHKAQETIADLKLENTRLSEMTEVLLDENIAISTSHQNDQAQVELELAWEEIQRLNQEIGEQEKQTNALSTSSFEKDPGRLSDRYIEILSLFSQDLRQPMSSIIGYTNLLLDEAVGILGASQRKFLERVNASAKRMEMLIDDLVKISILDGDQLLLNPESVMLGQAIDKAIADTSVQMREKKIVLRVDLPRQMPFIHADRDALQQVLINLLMNACAVTPNEGEIFLRADIHDSEKDQQFALVQVTDQGGGIPEGDLQRVFSRLYRADYPSITGIGDTGVGLSIVKTLVEAHDGRIWVDTEDGVGSTFSLLLPIAAASTLNE